jgi:general secretion pathway protein G
MRRAKRARVVRTAFTLLEVLMVIVILGILAALIVPQFSGTRKRAMVDATKIQIAGLDSDLERFRLHCGRYPTSDEGLAALLEQPDDEELEERWAGPYIKKAPRDAWGHDLYYESPGEYNEDSYDLYSAGPDAEPGTEDDIKNWEDTR